MEILIYNYVNLYGSLDYIPSIMRQQLRYRTQINNLFKVIEDNKNSTTPQDFFLSYYRKNGQYALRVSNKNKKKIYNSPLKFFFQNQAEYLLKNRNNKIIGCTTKEEDHLLNYYLIVEPVVAKEKLNLTIDCCIVCMEEKLNGKDYFVCEHNNLCNGCYTRLTKKICPYCRAELK